MTPPGETSDAAGPDSGGRRTASILALALLGGAATGVVAFLVGLLSLLPGGDGAVAAGLCFAAAALSFGLLANALLRR